MSISAATGTNMGIVTPALTTTFIPTATTCTENRLTMLANRDFEIWMNEPLPVPGTTFTDCYPSQFITSYLYSAGAVTQPAFNPLVCPDHYSAVGVFPSNYIACCPRFILLFLASCLARALTLLLKWLLTGQSNRGGIHQSPSFRRDMLYADRRGDACHCYQI